MDKIKIVIPSHKRANVMTTHKLVNDPIICVEQRQVDEYKRFNPGYEIVAHPNSVVGMAAKRQWMYHHFKDLWMLDDDTTKFLRTYVETNDYEIPKDVISKVLQDIYQLALDLNIYLFGITKNPRPIQYNAHEPIDLTGIICGGCFGIRDPKKSKLYFSQDLYCYNDFFVSLLNAYHNRMCLIDRRFAFVSTTGFKAKGGNAEFRKADVREQDYKMMKRMFGEAVDIKGNRKIAKSKAEFAITAKVRF